ncbi:hypothetical protein HMPREF3209_02219, partial [Lactobacillus crispatus]
MKKEAKVKDKNDILEFSNGEYEFEKEIENISFLNCQIKCNS